MSFFKKNLVLVLVCLLLTSIATIGYAALNESLYISSDLAIRQYKDVMFTSISLKEKSDDASEIITPKISKNTMTFGAVLPNPNPNANSITYTATIKNYGTSSAILQNKEIITTPSDQQFDNISEDLAPGVTIIAPGEELTIDFTLIRNQSIPVSMDKADVTCLVELTWIEYTDTTLLVANPPDLLNNSLTPVVYVENDPNETNVNKMGEGNWVVADPNNWYDYDNHQWANAVILASGVTKNVGETVSSNEMLGMYVWIPRYSFSIKSEDGTNYYGRTVNNIGATTATASHPGAVDIKFVGASTTDTGTGYYTGAVATNWLTHPAFQWDLNNDGTISDDENLSGIWVGKFTTTGTDTAPTVLPISQVLGSQTAYAQFTTAQIFKTYLNNSTNTDAHMMKNIEWGAVAYLSQSIYGKYGNKNYESSYKEVYMNPTLYANYFNKIKTGYSIGTYSHFNWTGNSIFYYSTYTDNVNTGSDVLAGVGASTTGTIYGVYDMAGGATERMMSYYDWGATNWGGNSEGNKSGFSSAPALRYYDTITDRYLSNASVAHAFQRWYNDNDVTTISINTKYPWIVRSGEYITSDTNPGIYTIGKDNGAAAGDVSFRSVLISTS